MAPPMQFPVNLMIYPDDLPKKYRYFLKDGPTYAANLVNKLLDERDLLLAESEGLVAANGKLVKLDTWEPSRLPPAEHDVFIDGPKSSTQMVTYLFQVILHLRETCDHHRKAREDGNADIRLKAERIDYLQREGNKIFEEKEAQDLKIKTMQARHNNTIGNLRSEKKLLSDENTNHVKAIAGGQIANKELRASNVQKDELIQQLQERIQVLEQQPQASNDPDAMVEDLPDGVLSPEQQIQYLQEDIVEYKEKLVAANSTVEGLQREKVDDVTKIQGLEERLQNGGSHYDQMQEQISQVQQKIDNLEKERAEDAAKIQDLEEQLQNGRIGYDQLQEQFSQSNQRGEVAKQIIAGLQQEKTDNLATIQSLQQPSSDGSLTTAQVQTLQDRVTQLQQNELAANQKITELQITVTNTAEERDIAEEARNTQSDKLVKKNTEFETVFQQLRTKTAQAEKYKSELNKAIEENDQLYQDAGENEATSGNRQETQKLHAENQKLRDENRDLKVELVGLDFQIGQVKEMEQVWQKKIDDAENKFTKVTEAKSQLLEKLSDANEKVAEVTRQLPRPEEEKVKFLVKENDRLRDDWTEISQKIEDTEELEEENKTLKTRCEKMAQEVEEATDKTDVAEGNAEFSEEGCRAAERENEMLERKVDQLEEENETLKEEKAQLSQNLIREDDGFILTPELHEVNQILDPEGKVIMTRDGIRATQQMVTDLENKMDKLKNGNKALKEKVTNTKTQLIFEPNGTIAKQEDYDALKETNSMFTTQVINTANEHFKKVQELEANHVYHEGVRVTQKQFEDTFSAASQAARHDNAMMVTQQQWVDTHGRASQAAINEDGTLVTNEQVQKLNSQIIRKSDGSVGTIEEVRELEAQVTKLRAQVEDLDAKLIRNNIGAIMTRSEIEQQWHEEAARLASGVKEAKDSMEVAEKKCLAMDKDIADLKAQAIDFQKRDIALVTEAKEAKEGRNVAEKNCLAMDKDITDLKAQAIDSQRKEIALVTEAKEAKEGKVVAEKKCLAMDKDIADLKAQAKDFQKKETDLVSEVQEAKEGKDVAEKKCLAIDKDIADLKAQAKDFQKKETDLVSEVKEAKESRNVAEKKCLAIDKDIAKLKAQLKDAQKAKDFAEKQWSEMKKSGSTPNPKRFNGTIVDQQGYDKEAKIRSDVIASLQSTIAEGEAKIAALQLTITEGEAKIAALELSKKEDEGEKTRLTAESKSARDKNAHLEKSKLEDAVEISRLTEELSSAKVEISKLEAAASDSAAEIRGLEDAFTRLQELYKQQGRQLERVESSQADLEQEHKEVKEVKQGMLKRIESLQHELKQALEKLGKLEQEHSSCANVKSNLTNLQSRVNKVEKQLSQKDEELETASKEFDKMYKLKEKTLEARNNAVADLKQALTQLSESKEDNQILATGKAEVEANLEAVTQESVGLMKAMDGMRDDITSQGKEIEGLEEENGVLRSKLQKKVDPSEPKASTPKPFPVTDSSAQKALLDSIAEEDEDDHVAVTEEEPLASTPILPSVLHHASYENGEADAPELPHATGTAAGNSNGQETASGAPEGPVALTPILPTVLDDASYENGGAGAPELPHVTQTAAGNSNGQQTASGAPTTIVPYQIQNEHPSATSGLGWKVNGFLWFLLLLLFFGVSMGVSWWRRTELIGRGDDLARLALISLRAGGGTGTAWPAWLYDDDVAEIVGGFYG